MALPVGHRLGPYELISALGAGGMGEVYRARDTRLRRDVALKILPAHVSRDTGRLARLEREARVLATLNHPHIAAIYGLEDANGTRALVLELVEGPTLAERLRGGAISIREALTMACQIAEALDAAHEKGIVHRDLKPDNIKMTSDGTVKVLDFGIAKVQLPESGVAEAATVTDVGTESGAVLGTVAYMSPEQARGQAVDKRTDIWAFGCVLYEMLTARPAFAGQKKSDTFARVLEREADWSRLPASTPAVIRRLLGRCLEKDAKRRLRDIGDARIDLEGALAPGVDQPPVVEREAERRRRWRWAVTSAILVATTAVGLWTWMNHRSGGDTRLAVTRLTVTLPPDQELDIRSQAMPLAISPDGRRLAYVADSAGRRQLFLRDLDAFEARLIAGTEGAQYPFFSPDGRALAFFADGKLKRVSLEGGSPVTVCDAPVIGRGGAWSADGTIVFDPGLSGLMQVSAAGGRPERLTSRDPQIDASNLEWPQFLPGDRALLATVGRDAASTLAVLSLDEGTWRQLGQGFQPQYIPSGHVLFHSPLVREGELHIVPFDLTRLVTAGAPVAVLDGVFRSNNAGGAYFAAAPGGTLVFARGGHARRLVRVDRNGRRAPLLDERRGFRLPRLSPDGRHLAVTIDPRPSQIWIYDLARRSGFPLTTADHNLNPVWTPNGRRVAWGGGPPRGRDILWRAADGSSAPERLLAGPRSLFSWSTDGRSFIFSEAHPTNQEDIWMMPSGGDPKPLLATPAMESAARLSPDDRWLAYMSDESGRAEVYVRPFPNVDDGKWLISSGGGGNPVWSPTGRELFYINGTALMSAAIEAKGATLQVSAPELLFSGPIQTGSPQFDVFPDGASFVMVEADPDARPTQIHVVLNWLEELKQRVAVK